MNVYFNPLDKACKSITGGVRQGDKLQFNIFYLKENFTLGEFFSLRTPLWGNAKRLPRRRRCLWERTGKKGVSIRYAKRPTDGQSALKLTKSGFIIIISL